MALDPSFWDEPIMLSWSIAPNFVRLFPERVSVACGRPEGEVPTSEPEREHYIRDMITALTRQGILKGD
jgi:hypothetical protein